MQEENKTEKFNPEEVNLQVSKHAMERYVQRVKNYQTPLEVNKAISLESSKFTTDIKKLYLSTEKIWQGAIGRNANAKIGMFANRNGWLLCVDTTNNVVVTLFKIDLGLSENLNQLFVTESLAKIKELQETFLKTQSDIDKQKFDLEVEKESITNEIKQLKESIARLEERAEGIRLYQRSLSKETGDALKAYRTAVENYACKDVFDLKTGTKDSSF